MPPGDHAGRLAFYEVRSAGSYTGRTRTRMNSRLELAILPQPSATTCGPTCLHAIYKYYGETLELESVIADVRELDEGGTFACRLGTHAVQRGYDVDLYTFNLQVFDPTWFQLAPGAMLERLRARRKAKGRGTLGLAIDGYVEFIEHGGAVLFEDLTTRLIRKYLNRGVPILTGLSSTFLYRAMREHGPKLDDDDIIGDPQGHFVVLCGYDKEARTVLVADPWHPNPAYQGLQYLVEIDRVLCAILLGILTHDADLLIITRKRHGPAHHDEREGDD